MMFLALAQFPEAVPREMARNYWDNYFITAGSDADWHPIWWLLSCPSSWGLCDSSDYCRRCMHALNRDFR